MFCECGCGELARLAFQTDARRGWKKGKPIRFLPHHHSKVLRVSVATRFWPKVNKTSTCWLWTGSISSGGYGGFGIRGTAKKAHRVSYELIVGPIPEGLELDHLCRVRHCVNPNHLEPVTRQENVRRGVGWAGDYGNAGKRRRRTHCNHGHEFTPENTQVRSDGLGRACRTCRLQHAHEGRMRDKLRALDQLQEGD